MRRPLLWIFSSLILGMTLGYLTNIKFILLFLLILLLIGFLKITSLVNKGTFFFIALGFILMYFYTNIYLPNLEKESGSSNYGYVISVKEKEKNKEDILLKTKDYGKVLLKSVKTKEKINLGSYIKFSGQFSKPKENPNPLVFNVKNYYYSQRIYSLVKSPKIKVISPKGRSIYRLYYYSGKSKEKFMSLIKTDSRSKGFIQALLFGDKSSIDGDTYKAFRLNGTAHVLAVSGLHLGILYGIYAFIYKRYKKSYITFLFSLFLIYYGFMCLWSISVTRAISLIFLKLYSKSRNLNFDLANCSSLIGIINLLYNPYSLLNCSFQLSFLAVFSIVFLRPVLVPKTSNFIGTILSINLPMSIYFAYVFHTYSLINIISNIPVIYLISLIMPMALLSLFLSMTIGYIPYLLQIVISQLIDFTITVNRFFYQAGKLIFTTPSWYLPLLLVILSLIFYSSSEDFLISYNRKKHKTLSFLLIGTIFFNLFLLPFTEDEFSDANLVFFATDKGLPTRISTKEGNFLVDGGYNRLKDSGDTILSPFFLNKGTTSIDSIFWTTSKVEDFSGLVSFQESMKVKNSKVFYEKNEKGSIKDLQYEVIYLCPPDTNGDSNTLAILFYNDKFNMVVIRKGDKAYTRELIEKLSKLNTYSNLVLNLGSGFSKKEITTILEETHPSIVVSNKPIKIDKSFNNIKFYSTSKRGAVGITYKNGRLESFTKLKEEN